MTTWSAVAKETGTVLTDAINIVQLQTSGYFSWSASAGGGVGWENTTDYTDAEHLVFSQQFGYQAPYISGTDGLWTSVDKQSSTWTPVVQSGTVAAQFELNEPLGGPEWTAVTKDT